MCKNMEQTILRTRLLKNEYLYIDNTLFRNIFIPEGYIYFSKYRKVINKRSAIVVC